MKLRILLLSLFLSACATSIKPVPAPVPNYHESLSVHAFGKLEVGEYVDWMFGNECQELKCEE